MFINRDLSYLYLPSACDLSERFFLKSLTMNVLFGNIDRKIGQVFPWGINTLTFPPKEWGAEPTPHSPPSREGSGGGGFGREPTPHCRVIYSYIHNFFNRKSAAVLYCTQKSAALPCCQSPTTVKSVYSKERRTAVFVKMGYVILKKSAAVPCFRKWGRFSIRHISHNSGDTVFCEFEGWQHLISKALVYFTSWRIENVHLW